MGTGLSDKILGCWNLASKNGPVERGDEGHVAWVAQLQPIRHQRPNAAASVKVLDLLYRIGLLCAEITHLQRASLLFSKQIAIVP